MILRSQACPVLLELNLTLLLTLMMFWGFFCQQPFFEETHLAKLFLTVFLGLELFISQNYSINCFRPQNGLSIDFNPILQEQDGSS